MGTPKFGINLSLKCQHFLRDHIKNIFQQNTCKKKKMKKRNASYKSINDYKFL